MNKISKLFLSAVYALFAFSSLSSAVAATNVAKAYKGTGVVECVHSGVYEEFRSGEEPISQEYLGEQTTFDISYDGKNFLVTENVNVEMSPLPWGPFKATLTKTNGQYTLSYCETQYCRDNDGADMRITFPINGGEVKVEEYTDYTGGYEWLDYFNYNVTTERVDFGYHAIVHAEGSGYCEFIPN